MLTKVTIMCHSDSFVQPDATEVACRPHRTHTHTHSIHFNVTLTFKKNNYRAIVNIDQSEKLFCVITLSTFMKMTCMWLK